jgi:3',5'-cyclic AMP phosphodiesterase CpdA
LRVRIVHFSDLHFWHLPDTCHALFDKRLLGCLNHLLRRRQRFDRRRLERAVARVGSLAPDWIVCTGDLTTTGTPTEFAEARAALKPMQAAALRGFVYVPGNHDAYVRDAACQQALAETCQALNDGSGLDAFPREITDRGLRMFLADSAHPTAPWRSSGQLPPATDAWLRDRLAAPRADGEGRMLIGHFPLRRADGGELSRRRRLHGADGLYELARAGAVDVALCGHIHEAFRRDGPGAMEVCAGSLTLEGKVNVLDFFPDSCTFSQFWLDMSEETSDPVLAGGQISATGAH